MSEEEANFTGDDFSVRTPKVYKGQNYDPRPHREKIRGIIAIILVITLVAVIGIILYKELWQKTEAVEIKDIAATILTPLIAVVGTVLGFYFGSKDN